MCDRLDMTDQLRALAFLQNQHDEAITAHIKRKAVVGNPSVDWYNLMVYNDADIMPPTQPVEPFCETHLKDGYPVKPRETHSLEYYRLEDNSTIGEASFTETVDLTDSKFVKCIGVEFIVQYRPGDCVILRGKARCNPNEEYDFKVGAKIALGRAIRSNPTWGKEERALIWDSIRRDNPTW